MVCIIHRTKRSAGGVVHLPTESQVGRNLIFYLYFMNACFRPTSNAISHCKKHIIFPEAPEGREHNIFHVLDFRIQKAWK